MWRRWGLVLALGWAVAASGAPRAGLAGARPVAEPGAGKAPPTNEGTFVCKLDGADLLRLGGPTVPAWLPGGKQLLLATSNSLYRIGADGTGKALVYQDRALAIILGLCVSPSGKFAAASVVRARDGAGAVRVWSVADGKLLVNDAVYEKAVVDEGARYLRAVLAWAPRRDRLAWVPMEYVGVSKRTRGVKVFDGETARWSTWYLERPVESLAWHPERETLLAATGETITEVDDNGRAQTALVPSIMGGGAGDSPLVWLPKSDAFYWGQGFYGRGGQPMLPELPDNDGPAAKVCWVAPDGRHLLLATSRVRDNGECETDLLLGGLGSALNTFRRTCRLTCVPQQVFLSVDGARIAYVVGGYVPD
jgi:hypothetical protein